MVRVLHVNDCVRRRQEVARLLAESAEFQLVAESAGREETLAGLAAEPDVVLLNPEAEGASEVVLWGKRNGRRPSLRVLLSASAITSACVAFCRAPGVRGFVPDDSGATGLQLALREVAAGHEYWSARYRAVFQSVCRGPRREAEILRRLAQGLADRQIARQLGLATSTVRTYLVRLQYRLGVRGRGNLLAAATRWGLLPAASRGALSRPNHPRATCEHQLASQWPADH